MQPAPVIHLSLDSTLHLRIGTDHGSYIPVTVCMYVCINNQEQSTTGVAITLRV